MALTAPLVRLKDLYFVNSTTYSVDGMQDKIGDPVEGRRRLPSTSFDEIFGRLMEAANVSKDSQLANILELKTQSIIAARKRGFIPPGWMITVADKFNVSLDWLRYGIGPRRRIGSDVQEDQARYEALSEGDFELIPLSESKVVAGPEGEILYEGIVEYYPFKKWWIERLVGKSEERKQCLVLIKVRGDSMSPTINQGELAMIDTWEAERLNVRTGRIYIVRQPDGATSLKRLAISQSGDKVKLVCFSDNVTDYEPFEFDLDPGRPVTHYVLGRVRWVGKEFD